MLRTLTSGEVKRGGSGKELNNNDIRNKNGIIVFLGHKTRDNWRRVLNPVTAYPSRNHQNIKQKLSSRYYQLDD
ncbi:hypothetical protein M8J75_001834 [Diaphorina citri]|nr:hypothetical protein M8J75_001834 [Diaphorina citri]